jgi:hypothetical protein
VNNRPKTTRIGRYSRTTNMVDLRKLATDYLTSLGLYDRKKQIGNLEIWYRKEGRETVAVGPTKESVTP